jgi:uncharacterized membrane protein YdbT with pleckstrin-like domain
VCLLLALTLNGSELVLLGLAHLGEQVLLPVVQHLPQLPYVCVCVYVWCVCVCVCVPVLLLLLLLLLLLIIIIITMMIQYTAPGPCGP